MRLPFVASLVATGLLGITVAFLSSDSPKAEAQVPVIVDIGVAGPPFAWTPNNYTVTVGTTVRWTATGPAPHTVTSEGCLDARIGPCTFDSGANAADYIRAGSPKTSYQYTFSQPGVYPFLCRLHGGIGGAGQFGFIVVYQPGQAPPSGNYKAPADLVARINAEKAAAAAPAPAPAIRPPATGEAGLQDLGDGGHGYVERMTPVLILLLIAGVTNVVLYHRFAPQSIRPRTDR